MTDIIRKHPNIMRFAIFDFFAAIFSDWWCFLLIPQTKASSKTCSSRQRRVVFSCAFSARCCARRREVANSLGRASRSQAWLLKATSIFGFSEKILRKKWVCSSHLAVHRMHRRSEAYGLHVVLSFHGSLGEAPELHVQRLSSLSQGLQLFRAAVAGGQQHFTLQTNGVATGQGFEDLKPGQRTVTGFMRWWGNTAIENTGSVLPRTKTLPTTASGTTPFSRFLVSCSWESLLRDKPAEQNLHCWRVQYCTLKGLWIEDRLESSHKCWNLFQTCRCIRCRIVEINCKLQRLTRPHLKSITKTCRLAVKTFGRLNLAYHATASSVHKQTLGGRRNRRAAHGALVQLPAEMAVSAHHVATGHQDHSWAMLVTDGTGHAGATGAWHGRFLLARRVIIFIPCGTKLIIWIWIIWIGRRRFIAALDWKALEPQLCKGFFKSHPQCVTIQILSLLQICFETEVSCVTIQSTHGCCFTTQLEMVRHLNNLSCDNLLRFSTICVDIPCQLLSESHGEGTDQPLSRFSLRADWTDRRAASHEQTQPRLLYELSCTHSCIPADTAIRVIATPWHAV